jgi:hypothetical protein
MFHKPAGAKLQNVIGKLRDNRMENITSITDKYLTLLVDNDANKIVGRPQAEMLGPYKDPKAEWFSWLPIKSTVTDKELMDFEKKLGHLLPDSYKTFLKHKHFYNLYIDQAEFCRHPINIWQTSLSEMIFNGWPRDLLIEKGYIPFACWTDWGMLCFDTTKKTPNNDYPIILWDHERENEFEPFADNFEKLLIRLDQLDIESRT